MVGAIKHACEKVSFFSYGFRPFFWGATLWAAAAMVIWGVMLSGLVPAGDGMSPISWHAHAFVFGYGGAVIAGFLLTAIPNWTQRPPLQGVALAGLFLVWVAGRIVVLWQDNFGIFWAAGLQLAFYGILTLYITRELIIAQNWRNLVLVAALCALMVGNGLFYKDVWEGNIAAQGGGLRLALAAILMLIVVIGGRIVPNFTKKWLASSFPGAAKKQPIAGNRFDRLVMLVSLCVLICWIIAPHWQGTGFAFCGVAALHFYRQSRWGVVHVASEPLLWSLHLGYACIGIGMAVMGSGIVLDNTMHAVAGQHILMAGGIGITSLAVMTRASLGHTGRALRAPCSTSVVYGLIIISVLVRACAAAWPEWASILYYISALCWGTGFAVFGVTYTPILFGKRVAP